MHITDRFEIYDNVLEVNSDLSDEYNTKFIDIINNNKIQIIKFSKYFSSCFSTELDFSLCESVTKILFDKSNDDYDKNFLNLPPNLKVIRFSNNYNQKLPELPSTLEEIYFGSKFNHQINNLPSGLIKLFLGNEFSQELSNLPTGLKYLSIEIGRSIILDFSYLPETLEYLNTMTYGIDKDNVNYELFSNLPNGLKNLVVSNSDYFNLNNLPNSIEYLSLFNLTKIPDRLPSNIKNLTIGFGTFGSNQNNMLLDLSNTNIVMLVLNSKSDDKKIKLIFPENLEILSFDYNNHNYDFTTLPSKIKYLFFNGCNNLCADNNDIEYELGQDSLQLMCTNGCGI